MAKWKVGDTYKVQDNGVIVIGKITRIDESGYHVRWNDGTVTIEDKPDAMQERMRG